MTLVTLCCVGSIVEGLSGVVGLNMRETKFWKVGSAGIKTPLMDDSTNITVPEMWKSIDDL